MRGVCILVQDRMCVVENDNGLPARPPPRCISNSYVAIVITAPLSVDTVCRQPEVFPEIIRLSVITSSNIWLNVDRHLVTGSLIPRRS
jgi:hypothetical protein